MMKKLMIIFALFTISFKASPTVNKTLDDDIILLPGYHDPTDVNNDYPRGPVQIPAVIHQNNSLRIRNIEGDYNIFLINSEGSVVYHSIVDDSSGDDVIVLPDTISGEYELHIHIDTHCYYGHINI